MDIRRFHSQYNDPFHLYIISNFVCYCNRKQAMEINFYRRHGKTFLQKKRKSSTIFFQQRKTTAAFTVIQ